MALSEETNRRPTLGRPTPLNISLNRRRNGLDDLGLGLRFIAKLTENRDKLCQVEAASGFTETNGGVLNRSIQAAMEMQVRGIQENDVILICSRCHRDQTIVLLASLLVGAVVAPIDPESSKIELKDFIVALKPKMIFSDARIYGQIEEIVRVSLNVQKCQVTLFGGRIEHLDFHKFLVQQPSADFKPVVVTDSRTKVAFIIPTQGTSGAPKLVCISHHAISQQIDYAAIILKDSDKLLTYFPLSWIPQVIIVCYCFVSLSVRIIPPPFNEKLSCKLIHDLRIDTLFLETHNAAMLVNHPSLHDYDISCLKYVYVGGSVTTAVDMTYLRTGFSKAQVFQFYVLTELSGLVCGFPKEEYGEALSMPGSVGKPLPGVKVKITGREPSTKTKPGKRGEILITGPTLMLGYYNDIHQTQASVDKSYIKTGDIGLVDEEGHLYIQGRTSDHIFLHGHILLPTDIEDIIMTHPFILEVVIVGDDKETVACIVRKPDCKLTTEMLLDFLHERLPRTKIPTKFKFMDSLPKTSVGKIKKEVLRQLVIRVSIEKSKSVLSNERSFSSDEDLPIKK